MTPAQKFVFGTDFREGSRRAASDADLVSARDEAFRSGQEQGRRDAEAQLNGLVGHLTRCAERLLAQEDARAATVEAQAAQVAIVTARALAGAALAEKPMADLEQAVRECLSHARLAPHLAVRVNESSVEAVEGMLKRLAQQNGYVGRLVVLGEPDIAPGDGRIEWADGGFVVDSQKVSRLVDKAVSAVFGTSLQADTRIGDER